MGIVHPIMKKATYINRRPASIRLFDSWLAVSGVAVRGKRVHHILKDNLECLYCSESPKEKTWFSEWNKDHHYKTFICGKCGHKNFTRVDFHGDGHDTYGELEKRISPCHIPSANRPIY